VGVFVTAVCTSEWGDVRKDTPQQRRFDREIDWRLDRVQISVIVPCCDCARYLGGALEALARQEVSVAWEVVVVDNGSRDGSQRVAEEFRNRLDLRLVEAADGAGAGFARNAGARAARGQKLLFVDADDEVSPGYVSAMALALESASFVTSRVDVRALNPHWIQEAHGPWQQDGLVFVSDSFLPAAGSNVGILRSLFESVGGFPQQFPGAAEDIAFAWTVQLAGVPLVFVPEAVYHYRHRPGLMGLFRQTLWWGSCMPVLYREFRAAGLPGRAPRTALGAWQLALRKLTGARSKGELAAAAAELGYCLGRLQGSFRHRVAYL
jgi:glycosyltransferase involved in cell wall biosynthesis